MSTAADLQSQSIAAETPRVEKAHTTVASSLSPVAIRPTEDQPSRKCRSGLMGVFLLIAFIQVVVSVVLIWYIGWRATTDTANSLSSQLRASVLDDCLNQLDSEFSTALRAAHHLRFMTEARFPTNFGDRLTVTNETGWLADMSALGSLYPRISRFGVANRRQLFYLLSRPTSLNSTAVLSNTGLVRVFLGQPTSATATSVTFQNYKPTPIHTTNLLPPFNYRGEIWNTDSPAAIQTYLGSVTSSAQNYVTTSRVFYTAAAAMALRGLGGGWSDPFAVSQPSPSASGQTRTFVGLAAFSTAFNATTREIEWTAFTVISLADFAPVLKALPIGTHGRAYLVSFAGACMSSSDDTLTDIISNTTAVIDMFTSDDEWLQRLWPILLELNLITRETITAANASDVVPYRDTTYEIGLSAGGSSYTMQAQMTDNITALQFTVVIVTKDSDFNGNVQEAIITTAWLSCVIGVAALIGSCILTSCVTRPLMRVVHYMKRAVRVIAMPRGEGQRAQLARLCHDWSADTHTDNIIKTTAAGAGLMYEPESVALVEADKEAACRIGHCTNIGRSLREVDLMHRSFGSMLYSLASYDELEAINQAKRAFIRYIFHEVRVPFNAIVLGIEQMQLDLKLHIRSSPACAMLASCLDTMSIVHEQSEVVSRILNDVLSMQKIEDGALALDISSFDVEKMIRVALHAFRVPCAEKRLKVDMSSLASLDAIVEAARSTVPLLHSHPSIQLGRQYAHEDGSSWHAHVEADPYRLRQALANFISNAIKFSRIEGTIQVALEFSQFVPSAEPVVRAPTICCDLLVDDVEAAGLSPMPRQSIGNDAQPRLAHPHEEAHTQQTTSGTSTMPANNHAHIDASGANPAQPLSEDEFDEEDAHDVVFDSDSNHIGRMLGSVSLTIRVRDSGVGLSAENASRMFQQYAQVSANKNQSGGGTGLGLSISKSIVELHGGGIGVTSVEGEGSEFFFTIPNTRVVLAKSDSHTSVLDGTRSRSDSASGSSSQSKGSSVGLGAGNSTRSSGTSLNKRRATAGTLLSIGGTSGAASPAQLSPSLGAVRRSSSLPQPLPMTLHVRGAASLDGGNSHTQLQPHASDPKEVFLHFDGAAQVDTDGVEAAPAVATAPENDPALVRSPAHSTSTSDSAPSSRPLTPARRGSLFTRVASLGRVERLLDHDAASPVVPLEGPSASAASYSPKRTIDLTPYVPDADGHANAPTTTTRAKLTVQRRLFPTATGTGASNGGTPPVTNNNTSAMQPIESPSVRPRLASNNINADPLNLTAIAPAPSPNPPRPIASTNAHSSRSSRATPVRAGARVLVVEDSLPNRKLLISILTHMKLLAVGVENGQECVDLFPAATDGSSTDRPADPFDVCIMDGNMPVMNGIDACRILRARGVSIPILALTGNALAEDVAAFIDAGATSVLTKPINRAQLLQALTLHLPATSSNSKNKR